MKKELNKALRDLFDRGMAARLPQFKQVKVESAYFWPGNRAYRWDSRPGLTAWVVLNPNPSGQDQFTVMVGWSTMDRYPELSMQPNLRRPEPDHAEFEELEYLTRLPFLWTQEDRWWIVRDLTKPNLESLMESIRALPSAEALALVEPHANDALDKLEQLALPYLQARANWNGTV